MALGNTYCRDITKHSLENWHWPLFWYCKHWSLCSGWRVSCAEIEKSNGKLRQIWQYITTIKEKTLRRLVKKYVHGEVALSKSAGRKRLAVFRAGNFDSKLWFGIKFFEKSSKISISALSILGRSLALATTLFWAMYTKLAWPGNWEKTIWIE